MNNALVRNGNLHGDGAVSGLDDLVSLLLEKSAGEVAQFRLVSPDRDRLRAGFGAMGFRCYDDLSRMLARRCALGQKYFESLSFSRFAVAQDVAATLLDDSVDGGESES